jgi:hypothetical protein
MVVGIFIGSSARIRVKIPLQNFIVPAEQGMMIEGRKKKGRSG